MKRRDKWLTEAQHAAALVLKKEVVDDGEADVGGGRDSPTLTITGQLAEETQRSLRTDLEEARSHVASKVGGTAGADGGGERDDRANDERDASPKGLCDGRPEQRADSQSESRQGEGPVGLVKAVRPESARSRARIVARDVREAPSILKVGQGTAIREAGLSDC